MKITYKRTDLCVPNNLPEITMHVNCRRARRATATAYARLTKINRQYWAAMAAKKATPEMEAQRCQAIARWQERKWTEKAIPDLQGIRRMFEDR